jgi:Protein of unknown function (DUF1573)
MGSGRVFCDGGGGAVAACTAGAGGAGGARIRLGLPGREFAADLSATRRHQFMAARATWSDYACVGAAAFLAFSAGHALVAPGNVPEVTVSPMEIDLGRVAVGQSAGGIFTLGNAGSARLIVRNVKSSCECGVPSLPRRDLMPGDSETLTIVFQPSAAGFHRHQILIQTNDPKRPSVVVTLAGTGIQ